MSTPKPDAEITKTEREQDDAAVPSQANPVHFATFSAHNAAAVHLLEAVQASCASHAPYLISDQETISYYLTLPSVANEPGFTPPAVDRWRLGAGPSATLTDKRIDCCRVELLLCPPGNTPGVKRARASIKHVHAVLYFHPDSGALVLRNLRSQAVLYRQGDVDAKDFPIYGGVKGQDSCILFRPRNHFRFGEYEFVLDFALDPEQREKFIAQRDTLLSRTHNFPSRHLAPIPTKDHFTLWNVRVHHAISQAADGPHDITYCGVQLHTGRPVAVKRMLYNKKTCQRVRRELEVASIFLGGHAGVLGSLDSWCQHDVSPPCRLEKCETPEDYERVFYSMPLAEYNFKTMPWAKLIFERRIGYLYQTLCGLDEIHTKGMIHGRIRPTCLLILPRPTSSVPSTASPQSLPTGAAISPAISSHSYEKSRHALWVAPEVSNSTEDNPDTTKKADIWALAASWLEAFAAVPNNIAINAKSFRQILKTLDTLHQKGKITKPFHRLLLRMLAWNPEDRPTTAEALSHVAWAPVRREMELQEDHNRREREDRIQGPDNGAKKVRVLSPDVEPAPLRQ